MAHTIARTYPFCSVIWSERALVYTSHPGNSQDSPMKSSFALKFTLKHKEVSGDNGGDNDAGRDETFM